MTDTAFSFVCLDPRKKKRRAIDKILSRGGKISWLRLAPMSLRSWPETTKEAEEALAMSKDGDRGNALNQLHLQLLKLQYNGARRHFAKRPNSVAVCWNGLNGTRRVFMQGAKAAGARTLFFELAPFPDRITVDPTGVNFANSLPRNIKPYRDWHTAESKGEWRALGKTITQRKPHATAANSVSNAPDLDEGPFVFAALQTPGDSQLRLFGGEFPTVPSFIDGLATAANHLPDGWHLRIKEHPTSPDSFADKIISVNPGKVFLDNENDTFTQVQKAEAVVTVNSSVGLEAMFFDKPVVACGQCFWAIKGVAHSAGTVERLSEFFSDPATVGFWDEAREAFLSFLDQEYYPQLDRQDSFALLKRRLNGPDDYGFWQVSI